MPFHASARRAYGFFVATLAALTLVGCATTTTPNTAAAQAPRASVQPSTATRVEEAEAERVRPATADEPDSIFFALRAATVDEAGMQKIRQHAERLKANPKEKVTLIGRMDDLGSQNYNLAITEERLIAVTQALRGYGVPARQILRGRISAEKNAKPCSNEACRQLMRRVELQYPG